MRSLQLLAIAALCPLATALASGCDTIVQPVGSYRAASPGPTRDPSSSGSGPGGAASDGMAMDGDQLPDTNPPMSGAPGDAGDGAAPVSNARPDASRPMMDSGVQVPAACTSTALDAVRRRLDMYVVMDANITIPYTGVNGLWDLVAMGLLRFVQDPRSERIGVGLRYFGDACEADTYDTPDVEVDVLPANAEKLKAALSSQPNYNTSPMLPALKGGIKHQYRRAVAEPGWKQVVVLMTDGLTQDFTCGSRASDLESAAAAGFADPTEVETYVIGFGLPMTNSQIADDILARFLPLDAVAAQGGGFAISVPAGSDPDAMNEALQRIRRQAQPCDFRLPNYDPSKVGLKFSDLGAIPRVTAKEACGILSGWHYDNNDNPTLIQLCPTTCRTLQLDDSMKAFLTVGCPPPRR
jgi:hypothetical protein